MPTEPTEPESYDPGIEEPSKEPKGVGARDGEVKPKPKPAPKPEPKK